MASGEVFWWAGFFAVPMGAALCLFLYPLWKMGKFDSWRCLLLGFELSWIVNIAGMHFFSTTLAADDWQSVVAEGSTMQWLGDFVIPFTEIVAAVGALFFAVWFVRWRGKTVE